MHSAWFRTNFLRVLRILQIKHCDLILGGKPLLQKVWVIWSPFLYLNFKTFLDPNSSSLIRFQCIVHESRVIFWEPFNFQKLKCGDLIFARIQFCRKSELFSPPFCISILKVLLTQILRHSLLDFIVFCMIEDYPSQSLGISTN